MEFVVEVRPVESVIPTTIEDGIEKAQPICIISQGIEIYRELLFQRSDYSVTHCIWYAADSRRMLARLT